MPVACALLCTAADSTIRQCCSFQASRYVCLLAQSSALCPSTLLRMRHRHAGLTDDGTLRTLLLDEPVAQLLALGEVSDSADNLNRTYLSPAHKRAAVLVSKTLQVTPS